jgi:haloalkane dehalogenase
MSVSEQIAWPVRRVDVQGVSMAYREAGTGGPIVFLHGNATSSYTWRKIAPYVEALGRVVAPDLLGMGASAKLQTAGAESYIYFIHRRYLDGLLAALGIDEGVVFIGHGWGAALACDWAVRHPGKVKGLCYMEAEITPLISTYMEPEAVEEYKFLRSRQGESMVLKTDYLLDKLLFTPLGRKLDDVERDEFFAPYQQPGESRRPLLEWEREVPINGIPADTSDILLSVRDWLATSEVPKLFIKAEPGLKMVGERLEAARAAVHQTELSVSAGAHPQEEVPGAIGLALAKWIGSLRR